MSRHVLTIDASNIKDKAKYDLNPDQIPKWRDAAS